MNGISVKWAVFGVFGVVVGVGTTLWFWSKTSEHLLAPYSQPRILPDQAFTREDRLNMMEAVYRQMFRTASSGIPAGAICFLGVGASDDAPPELIERLRNLPRPVEPVSSGGERIAARKTDVLGPSFIVRKAQMVSTNEAEVVALTQQSGQTKNHLFAVHRDDSAWIVTEKPDP